ncbi:phosphopyruvate hydratase [Dictyobacter aurantiacus]|uniref:Enolase n=1 Tax=Dictyobacter aurantiacus TaxID=1936993 RepID=A0A401ZPS7_9CHLR|nr:phosphopyruvate hydratase [Dictyobacter aurantiacus]GCE08879.1 enolase [Dictyobacter aurantiacus]
MTTTIKQLSAWEILDSRGRPTVKARCTLDSGATGIVSVPSGASTGAAEAHELRDNDPARYRGLGCRKAVANINGEINSALSRRPLAGQQELDTMLISLDGTPNKSRLGANAILAVSLAFARAVAIERQRPLYQHFADMQELSLRTLPRPTINLFSGGKHAGGQVDIQDVLLVPAAAQTMDEALAVTFAIYQSAAELTYKKYGTRSLTADEGGLAPPFPNTETMLTDAVEAIEIAGYTAGKDVALAIDVASSHFFQQGQYHLDGQQLSSADMIERLTDWSSRYPLVSIEDGLAEDDWDNWSGLHNRLAAQTLVLGDDFLCTNPTRIQRAITNQAANALLLKVNQIGTLSEAAQSYQLAHSAGWRVTISARSGETEDNWLADLAVGWSGDQIKIGSITHGERLTKYNRLLEIENETHLPLIKWPTLS